MTTTASHRLARNERGTAIIMVLLLLMVMSALAAALTLTGTTETAVVRNHSTRTQALTAAEAGLNHAAQAFIDRIALLDADDVPATLDAILADPTLMEPDIELGAVIALGGAAEALSYQTFIMDEDDPARGASATSLGDDADAANDEDGVATTDANRKVVIRSTGTGPNNTVVTLEAVLAPIEYGALVTEGDLELSGSVDIVGSGAAVHSNGDLTISGTGGDLPDGAITASGTYTGSFTGSSHAPEVPLPNVDPEDYRHHADFILTSNGTMVDAATGAVVCTWSAKTSCNSWDWNSGSLTWTVGNGVKTGTNGTYYVEGNATVAGSPGDASSPWVVTIIAEKSINISGSPDIAAHTDELVFVAGGDLEISGGLDSTNTLSAQGQILVHEQIKLSGNPSIFGQVIVEDAEDVESLVHANEITGNVDITYNGGLGTNLYSVRGWREVK